MIYDTKVSSVRSCDCFECFDLVYGACGDLCFSCEELGCEGYSGCQREDVGE